jgi:hypothetical protein
MLVSPCLAQFVDEVQFDGSEVLGYEPTLYSEDGSIQPVTLLGYYANEVPGGVSWADGAHGESSALGGAYERTMTGLLTPMIPGEAVWRQPAGPGVLEGNFHLGLPVSVSNRRSRVAVRAGPLAADLFSVGVLAIYSDLKGPRSELLPDDGFLGAITLNGALMLQLTQSAFLQVRASLYYLYTENKLGFYLGNGDGSSALLSYSTGLGNWDVRFDDRFTVYFPLSDTLDEVQVDEIAAAGRYRIGRVETPTNNPFNDQDTFFLNSARLTASTWVDDWKIRLHADRWDVWRSDGFEHTAEVNRLGAGAFYDAKDLSFLPWATYDWYDINRGQWSVQQTVIGATVPFTRTLQGYARGSWISVESETGRTFDRPGWELGFVHHVTSALSHSLFAGYSFSITDFGDPFLGSYWRYTVRYAPPGSRVTAAAYVQQSSNDLSSFESSTVGARLETRLSPRTRAWLVMGLTDTEQQSASVRTQIVRLALAHQLTRKLTGTLTYQFTQQDSDLASADFDEQLLMLSLQWNL